MASAGQESGVCVFAARGSRRILVGLARVQFCRLRRAVSMRAKYLVDPASSHMLVSKIKPCKCKYMLSNSETANGSLNHM